MGRPGRDRLHRRPPDRRDARPQRPAPGALPRHRATTASSWRPRWACCRSRKRTSSRSGGCSRARCCWSISKQGRLIPDEEIKATLAQEPSLQAVAGEAPRSCSRTCRAVAAQAPISNLPLLDRQQAFGYTQEDLKLLMTPMATTGRGSGRLDGHRHADLGAVGQVEAALHLFQAELRAGHEPADRPDPRRDS